MEECNKKEEKKLTYLEKLEIVNKFLKDKNGNKTVENLKKEVENNIKIIKRDIIKNKLSEELINDIENTLTNSYVKISYLSGDSTYTKLTYVKMGGDEYRFWIDYMYDFCIDVTNEFSGRVSYNFSKDQENNINCPYREEFSYCDDIKSKIYELFQIISKDDLDTILNSIINTIKVYA